MKAIKRLRIVRQARRFWCVVRNWNAAWDLCDWEDRCAGYAAKLGPQLDELDLPRRCGFPSRLAASEIGQALWLADQYGVELHIGTCFGDCRAMLPKDKWVYPISPHADPWSYSFFMLQKPEEVESIQAISRWPKIAICQCIVSAKRARVI